MDPILGASAAQSERSEDDSSNGGWAEATWRSRPSRSPPAVGQFSPLGETASACERLAQRFAHVPGRVSPDASLLQSKSQNRTTYPRGKAPVKCSLG